MNRAGSLSLLSPPLPPRGIDEGGVVGGE